MTTTLVRPVLITSANEVMYSSALVSLFVSKTMQKLLNKKEAHGLRKKPLDFGGNLRHVVAALQIIRHLQEQQIHCNTIFHQVFIVSRIPVPEYTERH